MSNTTFFQSVLVDDDRASTRAPFPRVPSALLALGLLLTGPNAFAQAKDEQPAQILQGFFGLMQQAMQQDQKSEQQQPQRSPSSNPASRPATIAPNSFVTPQPAASISSAAAGDAGPPGLQQITAPGTAVPDGSSSKALLDAESAARKDAARYAWNELRARPAFASDAMRFSAEQNGAMATALLEVCNFVKLDRTQDKSTKAITFQFNISCPSQDLTSRITDLKARSETKRQADLDAPTHEQVVYLFLSRRVLGMTSSSSDGNSYRASQQTFELVSAQPLEDGLVQQINSVGLSAVSYADLLVSGCASIDIADVRKEFSVTPPGQSDYGLTSSTRGTIIAAMRKCGVKYLALGAADVGVTERDPATGQRIGRVFASAQILDIRQQLPVTVARVRAIGDGAGSDELTAEEAAFAKAANEVGVKLVEQVKVRGIQ